MKFFVGVTDNNWFKFLSERKPDEVNFWLPSARQGFSALNPGELFLFKLHSPHNYIVGGGFFTSYSRLPISLSWRDFGEKNGATDYQTFFSLLSNHRSDNANIHHDFNIGNIILSYPFFFKREEWLPIPANWSNNIVRGKTYSILEEPGRSLFNKILIKLKKREFLRDGLEFYNKRKIYDQQEALPRFSEQFLTKSRLGQGTFAAIVREAYSKKCAITGGKALPVLEASHIKPVSEMGPNLASNGILLRSDFHTLFDKGYITITPDYHVLVSKRLKSEFKNGKEYYKYHEKKLLQLPLQEYMKPGRDFIDWHNNSIYLS